MTNPVKGAHTALDKLSDIREKGDSSTIAVLEKNLAFHVSGHVLHSLFWTNLSPDGGGEPSGPLAEVLEDTFGGFPAFRQQMTEAAATIQGSGGRWRRGSRSARGAAGARPPGQPRRRTQARRGEGHGNPVTVTPRRRRHGGPSAARRA